MNPKSYLRTERALHKLKVFVIIFLHTLSTEREYRLGILSITSLTYTPILHLLMCSGVLSHVLECFPEGSKKKIGSLRPAPPWNGRKKPHHRVNFTFGRNITFA